MISYSWYRSCSTILRALLSMLPDFLKPPVAEVALSVAFESLPNLSLAHIGLLWQRVRDELPNVEEHPPFAVPPLQQLDPGQIVPPSGPTITVLGFPSLPRVWFLNKSKTQLVQLQRDWLARNWRKVNEDDVYPRYSQIRASFQQDLDLFSTFLLTEGLGTLKPQQCEVTYVNNIVWGVGDLDQIITVFRPEFSDSYLTRPQAALVSMNFLMPPENNGPPGRLFIVAQPALRISDNQPILQLTLTARGVSKGESLKSLLKTLDAAHEWVVRGFASITTHTMHQKWGRIE